MPTTNLLRLDMHAFTDKVVYRPNDVMFIEVLAVDTFSLIPVATNSQDQYYYMYYITMDILDSAGQKIYTSYSQIDSGTATFTYKVPSAAPGGEYYIYVYGYYMSPAKKLVRIRDYSRDMLVVSGVLNQESYAPGDTVTGKLTVRQVDGEAFKTAPTYSFSVNFNSSQVQKLT